MLRRTQDLFRELDEAAAPASTLLYLTVSASFAFFIVSAWLV